MIHDARVQLLNDQAPQRGKFVAYWMQASQRAQCNHALEYAVRAANERREPVVAFFVLTDNFPEANLRSYAFMLEGLQETQTALRDRGIELVVWSGSPAETAVQVGNDASILVTDCGYTRIQKQWRSDAAGRLRCRMVQVESDVVVPVAAVSPKEEYAARTIRPKLHRLLSSYLVPLEAVPPQQDSLGLVSGGLELQDLERVLGGLKVNRAVPRTTRFRGGATTARRLLTDFVTNKLDHYDELRNDPNLEYISHMSPYLHFGQIAPLHIALEIAAAAKPGGQAYLEELIVRRELSVNFVHYNPRYDSFDGLPDWARLTLTEHERDRREYLYTTEELEGAQTHDPYWNAAQTEMVTTGKMHNTMRMYWGKKILEWSPSAQQAYSVALYLNNKYELDGRDPNSFAGVAWCFGKHDRPWQRRPIFGTVRYMNAAGLERKFKMNAYLQRHGS